ncbi:MAG: hypothetical protein CO023_04250 [Flavobacteriales bacterium CG_4_9_14_0_2_um_filter_35_242]|nr:hypothetical protein [Zetaproteobacteria bacterium]NDK18048.1 hypothetical protein [Flavobacteriales bacterium]OIO12903.1 MAG: hypothetical protein AUJ53_00990 [Flavobacteriaceae bacterium CG1_02_35_72]PIR13855.1 MAG: hypothetical protein COV50_05205 [Flavobacteriales bacterium CG11_big_fil_rev_8_21_14_0_20_35_7]PIV16640.1 MAG: hypothetical protein COS42_08915 [Flavobacteriales bacterium CG03_land_8_20_14_0_80_35_15]PIX06180.1 MAG: hypothetical protein COZ76_10195 [Flavobacteriales bacteriu
MDFLKIFFKTKPDPKPEPKPEINQSKALDVLFVENFIAKSGRFLYCQTTEDIKDHLVNILDQERWQNMLSFSKSLHKLMENFEINAADSINKADCFFTNCEHLIAEDGSILFSSKQLKEYKLVDLPQNFIVFAKTSQLVNNKGESLTGIKNRYQNNTIPSNITAIKNYNPNDTSTNFMTYGNNNAKNLYLLLLEDL